MLEEKINEPENGTSRNESLETRVVIGIRGNKEITGLDGGRERAGRGYSLWQRRKHGRGTERNF